MKTTTTGIREHLDQEVTALCTCWEITRVDGKVLRFTDSDEDVIENGNTYSSIGAYQRTAIETTSSLSVDNVDIVGSASDLALPEDELRAGLFDNAEIRVFITPWVGIVTGQLKMRRGFFGEVQTLPNGTFQVELRGIMQRLSYNYMNIFSATCLYDLGEPACGIPIRPDEITSGRNYAVGDFANIQQTGQLRGTYYPLSVGDPDFEIAGPDGNFDNSLFWYNTGTADAITQTADTYNGTYAARGGSDDSVLTQDIDLTENGTGLTLAKLDSGSCALSMRGQRRDTGGDQSRVKIQFIDDEGRELGVGKEASVNSAMSVTNFSLNDFTVEGWFKLNTTINSSDGFVTAGTDSFAGQGNDINFEFGALRLRTTLFNNNSVDRIVSPNTLASGVWMHLAVSRSGDDLRIYENFELVVEELGTGYLLPFDVEDIFGSMNGSLSATVQEFRIWDHARSNYELTLYGDRTISIGTSGLIRYYPFTDGTFDDRSGNDGATIGPGSNTVSTGTGPVAYAVSDGGVSATQQTALSSVGGTWSEFEFLDLSFPIGTRFARFEFITNMVTAPNSNAFLDSLTGYVIDTAESGDLRCEMLGDVMWECTTAGAGSGTLTTIAGIGDTISYGGAQFIGVTAFSRMGRVLSSSDARTFICEVSDARAVDAWFNGGNVLFETGANAGVAMEVKSWNSITREIELFLSLPTNISPGDTFCVYPGCDKSRISCAAIFDNVFNFFGTPDVPGTDELLRYPNANT